MRVVAQRRRRTANSHLRRTRTLGNASQAVVDSSGCQVLTTRKRLDLGELQGFQRPAAARALVERADKQTHTWEIAPEVQRGIVIKLRSMTPKTDRERDAGTASTLIERREALVEQLSGRQETPSVAATSGDDAPNRTAPPAGAAGPA
jgi:hypothetical protein